MKLLSSRRHLLSTSVFGLLGCEELLDIDVAPPPERVRRDALGALPDPAGQFGLERRALGEVLPGVLQVGLFLGDLPVLASVVLIPSLCDGGSRCQSKRPSRCRSGPAGCRSVRFRFRCGRS